jgi:DNA-directed RNA polymerase subunit RPC12/RpoP
MNTETAPKPLKWRCLCCGAFIVPEKDGFVQCKKCGWAADT